MERKLLFNLDVDSTALLCPNPNEFYSRAYIGGNVEGNFRLVPGVKYATKIARNIFDDVLQPSTCSFTETDSTLDAYEIYVTALSAMVSLCRFELETSFLGDWMVKGSNGSFEVADFMSYYWNELSMKISEEVERLRWQGDVAGLAPLNLVDGHIKKLLADLTTIKITPTTITVANVIDEMNKVYLALPSAVRAKRSDLRFFVSSDVYAAFSIAASQGNNNTFITAELAPTYLGIKLVIADGMAPEQMVLTLKDNLIYSFDAINDQTALKAINLEETVAEPVLRTRANLKLFFGHVNGNEIVVYA